MSSGNFPAIKVKQAWKPSHCCSQLRVYRRGRLQRAEGLKPAWCVSAPAHSSLPQRSVLPSADTRCREGDPREAGSDPVLPALGSAGQGAEGGRDGAEGEGRGVRPLPGVLPPRPVPPWPGGSRPPSHGAGKGRWGRITGGRRALPLPPRAPPRSPRRASRGGFSISFFSTSGNAPARPRRSCCAAAPALPPAAVGSGPPAAAAASWCAARPGILPAGGRAVSGHRRSGAAAAPRDPAAAAAKRGANGAGAASWRPARASVFMSSGAPPRPSLSAPRDWPIRPEGGGPARTGPAPPPCPPRGRRGHAPPALQGTCMGGPQRSSLAFGAPPPPAPPAGAASPSGGRRRWREAARAWAVEAARPLRLRAPGGAWGGRGRAGVREGRPDSATAAHPPPPPCSGASAAARPCVSSFRILKSPFARALDLISLRPTRCPQRRALHNMGRERDFTAVLAWAGCWGKGGEAAFRNCHDHKKFLWFSKRLPCLAANMPCWDLSCWTQEGSKYFVPESTGEYWGASPTNE